MTRSDATSRASVFRNPVTPARAVFERIRVGIGWRTAIEVTARTLPHCAACIAGTVARHIAIVERALSSKARGVGLDVLHRREVSRRRTTGVGDEDVDATEHVTGPVHEVGRARRRPHVRHDRDRACAHPCRRLGDLLLVAAAHRHVHAFGRERGGGRVSEPLGGGGDGRPATGDPEVHHRILPAPGLPTETVPTVSGSRRVRSATTARRCDPSAGR